VEIGSIARFPRLDSIVAAGHGLAAATCRVDTALRATEPTAGKPEIGAVFSTIVVRIALLVAGVAAVLSVRNAVAASDTAGGIERAGISARERPAAEAFSCASGATELVGVAVFGAIDEPIAAVGRSAVAAAGISAEIRVRGAVVTTLIVVDDAVAATGQRAVDSARVRLRIGVVVAVVALLGTIELTVAAELTGRAARKIEATI